MANIIADWNNVPTPLLLVIGEKLGSCEDFIRFSAVCKSWQSVFPELREGKKPLLLSPESPLLMLAEKVPEGSLLIGCDIDVNEDGLVEDTDGEEYGDVDQEESEEEDDDYMEENEEDVYQEESEEEDDDYLEENEEDVHQEESEEEDDDYMEENEEDVHQEESEEEDYDDTEESEEYHQVESDDDGMEENEEDHQEESEEKNEDDVDMEEGQELQHEESDVVADMLGGVEGYEGLKGNGVENMQEPEEDRKYTVGSAREFYRLSSGKMYTIELPEAAGKLILGTDKGWVITLGEDFQANLLHPLLRQQILLPSMRTFRVGNEDFPHNEKFDVFIRKVFMSSTVQSEGNALGNDTPNPIIMTIYGKHGYLGFAKLGDKVWTKVNISTCGFVDIAHYLGYFVAVDGSGDTYVTDVNDSRRGNAMGVRIALCPPLAAAESDFSEKYLVESRGTLWLLVRFRRVKLFKPPHHKIVKYITIGFLVWKMKHSRTGERSGDSDVITTWDPSNDLGNQAFFVGRNSSLSLPPSGYIRPNCIYFTDDAWDLYHGGGGGHDVGVFDVVSSTIAQQFRGQTSHLVSPALWYI